jgi:cytosine/adenosine deaminase-related metal-dependent hydrolase
MLNAHLHLDRAGTVDRRCLADDDEIHPLEDAHISLAKKHSLVSRLHEGPAFDVESIEDRVNECVDVMVEADTRRADTVADVTSDRVKLSSLEVMLKIKKARAEQIDFRVGAYSPLGFKDSEPERFELLVEGARKADFIGSLPERDDRADYPSHIGFYEHCGRLLRLGQDLGKPLHLHLDQRNDPSESATELLVEAVREFGAPPSADGEATVWAVHVLSPSAYDDARFERLVERLLEHDIGVICCPSAALGMRQLRAIATPTHNSIARVLELSAAGVHVRLGSDNIADVFSPSTTADLTDEIYLLSHALRFYDTDILAKFAAGVRLDSRDREVVRNHLRRNDEEIAKAIARTPRRGTSPSNGDGKTE